MTKFERSEFSQYGGYLYYKGKFVARFKRGGLVHFRNFLIKNFTVEEYFTAYDSGMAPLTILEQKGYISLNAAKVLEAAGYPQTSAGFQAYLEDRRMDRLINGSYKDGI